MNLFLYISTVLIWGSTWMAIHFQIGATPVLLSVFYRFALAAILFLPILILFKKRQSTSATDHAFFVMQGFCLFSFNFICFYIATSYIVSGLISVIFSLATLFNAFNGRLIWKQPISSTTFSATLFGLAGLVMLFWDSIIDDGISSDLLLGLGLPALGTYLFSLRNMISVRHSRKGLKPLTSNA